MTFRKNLRERLHVHAGVLVFCEMIESVSGEGKPVRVKHHAL
jgi:hypothetical protein